MHLQAYEEGNDRRDDAIELFKKQNNNKNTNDFWILTSQY